MRWPIAAYRIMNAFILVAIGGMFEHASHSTLAAVSAIYLVVTVFFEYGLSETSKDIERRANKETEDQNRRLAAEFDTYAVAENFLTLRLRRNTGAVAVLRSGDPEAIQYGTSSIAKKTAINETLRDLCESLSASCSKYKMIPRTEAWFRATYMEVQGSQGDERLVYFGWHTRDDNPPRSMSLGTKYQKGEGCAGAAWEKSRPVIEDFKDRHEWKENYPHQSANYTSMICVPVTRGYGPDPSTVIGVITVDTHVDLYFGDKDDRTQEEKVASLIRPYATYIAFITVVDGAVSDLIAKLPTAEPTAKELDETARKAIAAPEILPPINDVSPMPAETHPRRKPR